MRGAGVGLTAVFLAHVSPRAGVYAQKNGTVAITLSTVVNTCSKWF